MRAIVVVLAAVALSGCKSDPCEGVSGTCISARVEGAITQLDQLRVSLDAVTSQVSPSAASGFSLPVKLAIALPASATSPAMITVDALSGGQVVASSGPRAVAFTPGSHASFTFSLVGGGLPADLSSTDGMPGDMGGAVPGHVSVSATSLTFPTTVRGTMSATQTLIIYNRTGNPVATVPRDMAGSGGGGGGGDFMPVSVSPSTCNVGNNGLMIPAGVDCTLQMVFAPTASGQRSSSVDMTFDNGDSISVSFTGVATPAWSGEVAPQGAGAHLSAVWAAPGIARAVGNISSMGASYSSTQPGSWGFDGNLATAVLSISGTDATHAWAGVGGGIYAWQGGSWTAQTVNLADAGPPGSINGIWMVSNSDGYAVNSTGQVMHYNGSSWTLLANAGTSALYAIAGTGGGNFVVAGASGYLALGNSTGTLTPFSTGSTVTLRGVWAASATDVYAVGDSGTIVHCTGGAPPAGCGIESALSGANLTAVAGRVDTNNVPDIYAVGFLGNAVLHSNGNHSWTSVTVPKTSAMYGVYVLPTGEVYAVGDSSEINHYY